MGDDAAAAPVGESKTGRGVGGARAGRAAAAARTGEGRREREDVSGLGFGLRRGFLKDLMWVVFCKNDNNFDFSILHVEINLQGVAFLLFRSDKFDC